MFDWNDLRHFLAVARAGSTLAGARTLRVNQTTCARRVAALEASIGQRLFDRTQDGCLLTEAGRALLPRAEAVEAAVQDFADEAAFRERGLTGSIRVTASEAMANAALTPVLVDFARLYPDIRIEMIVTDRMLDLNGGEADVAIRASEKPVEGDLVIRKIVDCHWALYCSRGYAERHGRPNGVTDLDGHRVIGGAGEIADAPWVRWLAEAAPGAQVVTLSNTLTNQLSAVKAGLGIAPLPDIMAEDHEDVVRCGPYEDSRRSVIWLVAPPRLRDVARVRAFMDFVAPHVASMRQRRRLEAEARG